jgi:hypothetical protein
MRINHGLRTALALGCVVAVAAAASATASSGSRAAGGHGVFGSHSNRITNRWLPISKFHKTILRGVDGDEHLHIARTLKHRTKAFTYRGQRVKAAIVKDVVRNTRQHRKIEQTLDYFAQDKAGTVYYLGEDVNEYPRHGPISHEGEWRLGRDTKRPGILMPAHPRVGDSFKSEAVPGVTHETDTVVKRGLERHAGGVDYSHVMRIREDAGPPPEVEYKTYAPGVGVITEANGGLHLLKAIR